MPTGKQNVIRATALCVSTRDKPVKNTRKSGTIEPMTVAESSRQRASKRVKGSTAAAWEMVKGTTGSVCHPFVICGIYIERAAPYT